MGCFDVITDKIYCPFCGELQEDSEFQTKDLCCLMKRLSISEVKLAVEGEIRIYSICEKCDEWIELVIQGEKESEVSDESP